MADVKEIPPQMVLPAELQHLRVAAYCRVSTEHEEQDSSLELQEHYYRNLIDRIGKMPASFLKKPPD